MGALALILIANSQVVSAMGLIGFKVCIASEMKAQVTSQGKAVAGASVVRKVTFDGKDYVTEVKTDNAGNFILPTLYERTMWKNTPFEVQIEQEVMIHHNNVAHLGVEIVKRNFDENGEINDMDDVKKGTSTLKPYAFVCELNDEIHKRGVHETRAVLSGKCLTINEFNSRK